MIELDLKQAQKNTKCQKFTNVISTIWKHMISWRFAYLFLFGLGQLLSIFLDDPTNVASYYSPLFLLVVSCLIKLLLLKGKISLKHFVLMQLDFMGPYVLTVINIVLLLQCLSAFKQLYQISQVIPDPTSYAVVNSLQFLLGTIICSLLMNRRTTTNFQYYLVMVNIVIQAASNLQQTVSTIQSINQTMDYFRDQNQAYLLQLIDKNITENDYAYFYQVLSDTQAALETAKDFSLACIASVISLLLILMDLIRRPLQKIQHQRQILEGFLQKSDTQNNTSNLINSNTNNCHKTQNQKCQKISTRKSFQLPLYVQNSDRKTI